jgi:hypothetical protein
MRGAFVVWLQKVNENGQFEGSIEEVDTGRQSRFASDRELIEFLRQRFTQARQSHEKKEERDEHNDHRE